MQRPIALIISIFIAQFVCSQELYGVAFTVKQGLLSKECYDLDYDAKGYLITGTQYGIMKYNGNRFQPICLNIPLESRFFYDFEKDKKTGIVYAFNSKNELYRIQNDKATLLPIGNNFLQKLPNLQIWSLKLIGNRLYVYSNEFTVYVDLKKNCLVKPNDYAVDGDNIDVLYEENQPYVLKRPQHFLNEKKLKRFCIHIDHHDFYKPERYNYDSREDLIAIGGRTFLLVNKKLFIYQNGKLNDTPFSSIFYMKTFHNRIWLCGLNGLFELDLNGQLIHHHFKDRTVGSVIQAGKKGMIISFNRNGLLYVRNIDERIYTINQPKGISIINGKSYLYDQFGNLFSLFNNQIIPINRKNLLQGQQDTNRITQIKSINNRNETVVSTESSVYLFNNQLTQLQKRLYTSRNKVLGFSPRDFIYQKGKLFIVTYGSIVQTLPSFKYISAIGRSRCSVQVNDSISLIGTNNGLLQLNTNTGVVEFIFKDLTGKAISDLKLQHNKIYVLSRFNGIYVLSNSKIIQRIPSPSASLESIQFYHNHPVVCGNEGIFLLKNNRWLLLFEDEIEKFNIQNDQLIILLENQIIVKKIDFNKSLNTTLFTTSKVKVNTTFMSNISRHKLPFNSSIQFQFDIVNFESDRNGIYYVLKGDRTFRKRTEGTILNFDALESGTYDLTVYPTSDNQINFSKPLRFKFEIEKPYWQTWLFYTIALLILSLLIYILRLLFIIRKKRRQSERNRLESQLNEYKLLAVKAQVNPHFLSNGFAAVQALILKNETEKAAQYLAKFSLFMRRILYYSESQFITVKEELDIIDLYIDLEQLRFKDKFIVKHDIQLTDHQLNNWKVPALLLQPIVENAIWHGLKNSSEHPVLSIRMNAVSNHQLHIEIEDNGPGIEPNKQRVNHLSKGNRLILDRIDALHKQFSLEVAKFELLSSNNGTKAIFDFSSAIIEHH